MTANSFFSFLLSLSLLWKLFFVFFLSFGLISICGFNQFFWSNLMTLCTLYDTNLWFDACFKFLMQIKYSSLPWKLSPIFSMFSIFIILGKKGKLLWSKSMQFFWILKISFNKISYIAVFIIDCYKIFIELRYFFNPIKIIFR